MICSRIADTHDMEAISRHTHMYGLCHLMPCQALLPSQPCKCFANCVCLRLLCSGVQWWNDCTPSTDCILSHTH